MRVYLYIYIFIYTHIFSFRSFDHFRVSCLAPVSLCPPEVLYEDLQYLSISVVALAAAAALLMLIMWLLDKVYRRIVAWRRRRRMPGKVKQLCVEWERGLKVVLGVC